MMIKFFEILRTPLPFLKPYQKILLRFFLVIFSRFIRFKNDHVLLSINEPVIFAFNHNNSFETLIVALYMIYRRQGQKVSFISDWMYGKLPIIGWFLKQVDPIYVYNKPARWKFINKWKRGKAQGHVYSQCVKKLKDGCSIVIFPEGKRNKNPDTLMKGRKGIGEIVLQSGVPVVPIGIYFPNRKIYGRIPKIGSVMLNFGEKMEFKEEGFLSKNYRHNRYIDNKQTKILKMYLCKQISHQIMMRLSELSGKNYPYSTPVTNQLNWALPEI